MTSFNLQAKLLHWLSAIIIIWASISGFSLLLPSISEPVKSGIAQFNVSITFSLIPFFLWRIVNRLRNGAPDYQGVISTGQAKVARVLHMLMYVVVTTVLVSGVLMMDKPFGVFGLLEFSPLLSSEYGLELAKWTHEHSTKWLAGLILLHLVALLKHELSGKRILKRMC